MTSQAQGQSIPGTLHQLPFLGGDRADYVAPHYADLVDEHGVSDVLVLKRFPTGIETFTDRLAQTTDSIERPRVKSVNRHARSLLETVDDSPTQLQDVERAELAHRFLENYEWTTPYLSQAATHEQFETDLPRLTKVLTWRGEPLSSPHDSLDEIGRHHRAFQDWLGEHDYIERGHVIPHVIDCLDEGQIADDVLDFEAILVVEFEEFAAIDRAYLERLAAHADGNLTCVAERDCAIQRVWNEVGAVPAGESATGDAEPTTRPAAVARYLATGDHPEDPSDGTVTVIHESTFAAQVRAVTDEIERLRDEHGWTYDEFAIGFRDGNEPINETIRILHQAGIPTASASVSGFTDDPAVRELQFVVETFAGDEPEPRARLVERLPEATDTLFEQLDADEDTLEGTLRRWALETGLKERIAGEHEPLEAKAQFSHVTEVFDLAGFIDQSPLIDTSWNSLAAALERAHQNAAAETQTAEIDVKEDGVLVDAVRVMKNAEWRAVFMLNCVEGTYPSGPNLTGLFPTTAVATMPDYPGVTAVSVEDVEATFATARGPDAETIHDPFRRYYQELSRRQLAVGARAATDHLYFGLFDQESGELNRQLQPSRYLIDAYEALPWLGTHEGDAIHGENRAIQFALSRVDHALTGVNGAEMNGTRIDLDAVERDLGAIEQLLAESGERGDRLRDAVEARIDFAAGEVRRDE